MRTVNQSGDTPQRIGTESEISTAHVESTVNQLIIDQLAHVQEAPNGMEPSRSPAIASRENRDYQRATGPYTGHHSARADIA